MRMTREQILAILAAVRRRAGGDAAVYLFGSRLDDRAKGGDIDLLIETDTPLTLTERARIKLELETGLGLPVDIIVMGRHGARTPFQRLALARALRLEIGT